MHSVQAYFFIDENIKTYVFWLVKKELVVYKKKTFILYQIIESNLKKKIKRKKIEWDLVSFINLIQHDYIMNLIEIRSKKIRSVWNGWIIKYFIGLFSF